MILPQALRRILRAPRNQLANLLKLSSLASAIGPAVRLDRPLQIFAVLALACLVPIVIASWLVQRLEARFALAWAR